MNVPKDKKGGFWGGLFRSKSSATSSGKLVGSLLFELLALRPLADLGVCLFVPVEQD